MASESTTGNIFSGLRVVGNDHPNREGVLR
jgi:hypothetical protein